MAKKFFSNLGKKIKSLGNKGVSKAKETFRGIISKIRGNTAAKIKSNINSNASRVSAFRDYQNKKSLYSKINPVAGRNHDMSLKIRLNAAQGNSGFLMNQSKELLSLLQKYSPVLTGLYRSSWQVTAATHDSEGRSELSLTMHNPQPYSERIEEEGWSSKAPHGAIRPAVTEFNSIMQQRQQQQQNKEVEAAKKSFVGGIIDKLKSRLKTTK